MNKFYKSVSVKERTPSKHGWYMVFYENSEEINKKLEWIGWWNDDGMKVNHVAYWLEESDFSEIRLAKTVIKVLDIKAKAGCTEQSWIGFQNGNGTEIGVDIERIIKLAKRILVNFNSSIK